MQEIIVYNYGDQEIEAVRTGDGLLVSDEQIGKALGYENPARSISNLVKRNAEELSGLSVVIDLVSTDGKTYSKRVWGEQGVMAITFLAKTKTAMDFRKWARETLFAIAKREPLTEVDRLASAANLIAQAHEAKFQAIGATLSEQAQRMDALEENQKRVDPQAIERRMRALHDVAIALVNGTKGREKPVTYPAFWRAVKARVSIASFQNRAALTVPLVDEAIAFARRWCYSEGVEPPAIVVQLEIEKAG